MTQASDDKFGQVLRGILGNAARTLGRDLRAYWPATGLNDCAEANVVVHVGAAFAAANFAIYSAVALDPRSPERGDGRVGHLDLLAQGGRHWVAAEAKRLYSAEKARSIARDWARLATHKPTTDHGNREAEPLFRVVLATTWDEKAAERWRVASPGDAEEDGWTELAECLKQAQTRGRAKLQHDEQWGTQWLLWAFGRVPAPSPRARPKRVRV